MEKCEHHIFLLLIWAWWSRLLFSRFSWWILRSSQSRRDPTGLVLTLALVLIRALCCRRRTNPPFLPSIMNAPHDTTPSLGAVTHSQPGGRNPPVIWEPRPQAWCWRSRSDDANRTTSSAKRRDAILRSPRTAEQNGSWKHVRNFRPGDQYCCCSGGRPVSLGNVLNPKLWMCMKEFYSFTPLLSGCWTPLSGCKS